MTNIQMPQMKKELGVRDFNERYRWIAINSTNDAIQEYARFGQIYTGGGREREVFTLYVDARFEFSEVLAWVQAHGEEVSE